MSYVKLLTKSRWSVYMHKPPLVSIFAACGHMDKTVYHDEETGKWYVELLPRSLWQALSIHEALEKAFVNDGYSYDRLVYKIKRNVLMVEVYFHKHRSDNRRLIELSINNHEVKLKRNEKNQ